ncbi:MAG: GumC family protein [Candidatus Pollutiaquabacter aromativorans]
MMQSQQPIPELQQEQEEQGIDLRYFFFNYVLRYWYLYIISLALALIVAYYYTWYVTPIYRASATVMVKQPKSSTDAADILKQLDDFTTDRNIQNEIEVLRSRGLIMKTVKDLNFDISYYLKGFVKTSERYNDAPFRFRPDTLNYFAYSTPVHIRILNDAKFEFGYFDPREEKEITGTYRFGEKITNRIGVFSLEKMDFFNNTAFNNPKFEKRNYILRFNNPERLVDQYQSALEVAIPNKQSSILRLSLENAVPDKAVDFLGKLIEVWLQSNIEDKNELARNSLNFIDEQLAIITRDLNEVEGEYEKFRSEKGITDVQTEAQSYLESAKYYDSRISEIDLKLSFLNYLENYVRQEKDLKGLSPASIGIDDALLLKLITQLNDLENQRSLLSTSATSDNPRMIELNLAIQNTKTDLLENIKSIRAGLKASQSEATTQLSRVEGKIRLLPGSQRVIVNIERQRDVKAALYTYLMQKRAETAIILASTISDNKLIDRPSAGLTPVRPVKMQIYAIAILLGLLLPVAFTYLRDALNDKIQDRVSLERSTSIPMLGIVGLSDITTEMIVREKPKGYIAEAFRSIRTNLQYFNPDRKKCFTVLVTSSIPAEGKSFCALNLATIIAMSGKRTILVGMDLRKPKSPERMELNSNVGVSNFLIGAVELKEVIQKVER